MSASLIALNHGCISSCYFSPQQKETKVGNTSVLGGYLAKKNFKSVRGHQHCQIPACHFWSRKLSISCYCKLKPNSSLLFGWFPSSLFNCDDMLLFSLMSSVSLDLPVIFHVLILRSLQSSYA